MFFFNNLDLLLSISHISQNIFQHNQLFVGTLDSGDRALATNVAVNQSGHVTNDPTRSLDGAVTRTRPVLSRDWDDASFSGVHVSGERPPSGGAEAT